MTESYLEKIFVVSTAHLRRETAAAADVGPVDHPLSVSPYGYYCYAYPDAAFTSNTLPEDIRPVCAAAVAAGALHVRFDCDSAKHPDLPTYDW